MEEEQRDTDEIGDHQDCVHGVYDGRSDGVLPWSHDPAPEFWLTVDRARCIMIGCMHAEGRLRCTARIERTYAGTCHLNLPNLVKVAMGRRHGV